MRSYRHLFERIVSFPNLLLAARLAQRGKRFRGEVAQFNFNLESNLLRLQEELISGTWKPGPFRHFTIFEPKERPIVAAPYRDRVVHHALCSVIEPLFDRSFIEDSYACRIGKGTHAGLDRCHDFLRQSRYVLQCDVRKFFFSIDHEILLKIVSMKIKDAQTFELIRRIVASGTASTPQSGLPIGNLTSQLFANVYLNELDRFVKQELKMRLYLRYMDDFLFFGNDNGELWKIKNQIIRFLDEKLRLRIHEQKSSVVPVRIGISFLGFRLFPGYRRLKGANVAAFVKRFKAMRENWQRSGRKSRLAPLSRDRFAEFQKMTESVRSWVAHAEHADTWNLRADVLSGVRL